MHDSCRGAEERSSWALSYVPQVKAPQSSRHCDASVPQCRRKCALRVTLLVAATLERPTRHIPQAPFAPNRARTSYLEHYGNRRWDFTKGWLVLFTMGYARMQFIQVAARPSNGCFDGAMPPDRRLHHVVGVQRFRKFLRFALLFRLSQVYDTANVARSPSVLGRSTKGA